MKRLCAWLVVDGLGLIDECEDAIDRGQSLIEHRVEAADRARCRRGDANRADHPEEIAQGHEIVRDADARQIENAGERDAAKHF